MRSVSRGRQPQGKRQVHILINALALHREPDGSRTVLSSLLSELPRLLPNATVSAVVRRDHPELAQEGLNLIELRSGSALSRVLDDYIRFPMIATRLAADVVISPNESVAKRLKAAVLVIAQNVIYHCPHIEPLSTGSALARLRSRLQFAFYRAQMPRTFRRADGVVAVSRHAAGELGQHCNLSQAIVTVVPEGADGLPLLPRRGPMVPRQILVVGALAPYKRPEVAISALAELLHDGDYELSFVGVEWPGYGRVVDDLIGSAGLTDRCRRTGPVTPAELARLYASAHVSLTLSRCESFGLPVVEAMRAGLPVVVADQEWSRETAGSAAVFVSGSDPLSVASGIRKLSDEAEWQNRSSAGIEHAAVFTWKKFASEIGTVAQQLATSRPESLDV